MAGAWALVIAQDVSASACTLVAMEGTGVVAEVIIHLITIIMEAITDMADIMAVITISTSIAVIIFM